MARRAPAPPSSADATATTWWRSLAFAVTGLGWGALWWVILLYGVVVALGAGPLWLVAAPGTVVLARQGARAERARVRAQLGVAIPSPYRAAPGSWWERFKAGAADPATWRDLTALALLGPASLLALAGVVITAGAALGLLLSPLWLGPGEVELIGVDLPRLAAAVALPLAGLALAAAVPLLAPRLLRLPEALDLALLGSDRAALRAQTRRLARSLDLTEEAAEAERRRIERDLHDGVQPRLVTLAMDLGLARQALDRGDADRAGELVARAHEQAKLAIAGLREVARGVHPEVLERRGLTAALATLGEGGGLPVAVAVDLPGRPAPEVERAAWFVAAEAVANAVRHSGASHVAVSVELAGPHTMVVRVGDDGRGGAAPAGGGGLDGLRARAESLGGALAVTSPPGGPTTVEATLPFPDRDVQEVT
ncbi:MAG: sensor domain-containing protein [Acidimicrobiales bacterium]|nr:sensor domain-containing protein [Acidimicrobiales bacterium]